MADKFVELLPANDLTVAFIRRAPGARSVLVAVNTTGGTTTLPMPQPGRIIIATERTLDSSLAGSLLRLPPFSAAWDVIHNAAQALGRSL